MLTIKRLETFIPNFAPLYWHVGQISWLISLSWKFGVRTHFFQSSVQFQKQLRNSGKQFQSDKHFEIHFGIRRRVNINSVMQESTDDLTFRHVYSIDSDFNITAQDHSPMQQPTCQINTYFRGRNNCEQKEIHHTFETERTNSTFLISHNMLKADCLD